MPTVRGVHFQPISYIGRYPSDPEDADRITIPDVITNLVTQTEGELQPQNFLPRRQQDAHCSFSGLFTLKGERLHAITARKNRDVLLPPDASGTHFKTVWESTRSFMNLHWKMSEPEPAGTGACCGGGQIYYQIAASGFTISCMPFQDVWSLDLDRVQRCCGHVVTRDARIMPFCTHYLTAKDGRRLYPPEL
jgi:uncharacterized radical SAM superfamily Fe-S cluster-containing enzyme